MTEARVILFDRPGRRIVQDSAGPMDVSTPSRSSQQDQSRVQLRLPLEDLIQVEKDLALIRDAVVESIETVRKARRCDMPSMLVIVRKRLEAVNRLLNAKHQGR